MNNLFAKSNCGKFFLVTFLILNLLIFDGKAAVAEQKQPMNPVTVSGSVLAQKNQAHLYSVADAYVYAYAYRNWNRSNRGKYEQLVAGWHPTGGESRTYIRFDLNGINPSGVKRAVLRLYHTSTYGGDGVKLGVYRVGDPWIEGRDTYHSGQVEKTAGPGVLSWVQQPVFNSSLEASFSPGMGQGDYVEVDVTALVREWLAGFQNNGLLIKPAGNMYSAVPESTYHFASREVADKDHWPVLIINGPPVSSTITSKPTALNQIGTVTSLGVMRWQPHTTSEGLYSIQSNQLCINSMKPGGAWFTTKRPYNFNHNYSVEFNFKLNTNNNHWTVLYSDGFIYVHIDWGTTFAWYQPGSSWGERTSNSLATNRWYKLRVDANPSQNKFDIYLDNNLLGTATNVKPVHSYHTLPHQINDQNIIWFGDPDSKAERGGNYNRGSVCWKNISYSGTLINPNNNSTTKAIKNVVGKWKWFNGVTVTFDQYGSVTGSNGGKGTLKVNTNNNNIEYVIKWSNGYTDWLKLNGNTLKGKNQNGTTVWGNRIIPINNNNQTSENVWAINSANYIYSWNGRNWDVHPGKAQDIGVGANGTVWIVGTGKPNGEIYRWMGNQFVKVPGGAVRVDVGPWGTPWVVNSVGDIYKWENKIWKQIPGKATDIGVGANGTVWALGNRAVFGGFEVFRWTGSTFVKVPGAAVRIDVDPKGNPWVVNSFGVIYRWGNNTWHILPGRAKDISVGSNGSVWIIGTNSVAGGYGIYRWNEKRQNWDRIPGGATAISVGGMQKGNLIKPVPNRFVNAVAKPCGSNVEFVRSLYQSILGRDILLPLKAGHGLGWVQALQKGVPRKQIITNFFYSPEYKNKNKPWTGFIKDAYQACLGRNPSANEVSKWHKNNYGQALQVFFNSPEYANLMASCHKKTSNNSRNKLFDHNIVGQWKWHSGTVVSIYPNGKVKSSDGNYGTWTTGSSTDIFVIHWIKGQNVDRLSLKGDNLKGKNQNGLKLSAKKIVVDIKSGKYRVEQYIGSTYKSEWKIQVKKGKITGKSEWTCCPGRRTDPIRGYINGYTVVIERDCSGQNWSGACRQKFVGTLMGPKIEGTCTGTGIVGTGHWVLFLK